MPIYQAFNRRNKSWVKYKFTGRGIKILNVKEREPLKKFVNVPVRGQWKNGLEVTSNIS